jgi:hypothetical protein
MSRDLPGPKVLQGLKVTLGQQVHKVFRVTLGQQVHKVNKALLVHKVFKVTVGQQVHKVNKALLVHKVFKVTLEQPELLVQILQFRGLLVLRELPAHREISEQLDRRVNRDPPGVVEHLVLMDLSMIQHHRLLQQQELNKRLL